jgi:hypothetical protein
VFVDSSSDYVGILGSQWATGTKYLN